MLKKLYVSKQFNNLPVEEHCNTEWEVMEVLERKYMEWKQLQKLQWIGQPKLEYEQAGASFSDIIMRIPEIQGAEVSHNEEG